MKYFVALRDSKDEPLVLISNFEDDSLVTISVMSSESKFVLQDKNQEFRKLQSNRPVESLTPPIIEKLLSGVSNPKFKLQPVLLEDLCRIYILIVDPFPLRIAWFELAKQALDPKTLFSSFWECSSVIQDVALARLAHQEEEMIQVVQHARDLEAEFLMRERLLLLKFQELIRDAKKKESGDQSGSSIEEEYNEDLKPSSVSFIPTVKEESPSIHSPSPTNSLGSQRTASEEYETHETEKTSGESSETESE
ncbi:XRCC4 nonhomologous end joining factor Xrc4 [Schizosaccharomyces osmophilus]|uniref:XRCC4 nonhomologous end joining factor Xrc4 n=1 Tax=Schizosaccharomyces osmophilus TaxID=2545709 RepID=A0AAE9W836_9SCHI|nr:XRCC4 nonhomologous end joining factor Xrc4 [Schizosaccharomyces osmophilus]WBW71095.1 XRCC4 nonhomologous end joining factor Xrc4 [Schizosaccharomyces osmophilus]